MDDRTRACEAALQSIASMTARSKNARDKFAEGTSHYTLQTNRMHALGVASALIRHELSGRTDADACTTESLEKARAPLASLISKSEKAQQKLKAGTWQHTMLGDNLRALYIGTALLSKALGAVPKGPSEL